MWDGSDCHVTCMWDFFGKQIFKKASVNQVIWTKSKPPHLFHTFLLPLLPLTIHALITQSNLCSVSNTICPLIPNGKSTLHSLRCQQMYYFACLNLHLRFPDTTPTEAISLITHKAAVNTSTQPHEALSLPHAWSHPCILNGATLELRSRTSRVECSWESDCCVCALIVVCELPFFWQCFRSSPTWECPWRFGVDKMDVV